MPNELGLVHFYYGNGKGKTTAAIGLAVRMLGRKRSVLFAQFLKGIKTGETGPLHTLGAKILSEDTITSFTPFMSEQERQKSIEENLSRFAEVNHLLRAEHFDLVVLDEVVDIVAMGYLPLASLTELIQEKPERTELVLTGHTPYPELIELADYVTEMKAIKHP